jgi:DNA-binding transcriptional MerR regulator
MQLIIELKDENLFIDRNYLDNNKRINKKEFSTQEIAEIFHISLPKINDWVKRGLITPDISEGNGPGTRRLFSKKYIEKIYVAIILRNNGISRKTIKDILEKTKYKVKSEEVFIVSSEFASELLQKHINNLTNQGRPPGPHFKEKRCLSWKTNP